MDAGLSNLTSLKANLLALGLRVRTDWDAILVTVGKGVRGLFERHCNRYFPYLAGDVVSFSADRDCFVVPRYPIVTLTTLQYRDDIDSDFTTVSPGDYISDYDGTNGLLKFFDTLGESQVQWRLTYTGGYWYDTSESNTGTLPAGATAVPDDLLHAWLQHIRATWQTIDRLGSDVTRSPDATTNLQRITTLKLSDEVRLVLDAYRRFQIT